MSPNLTKAILAIEDQRFYEHHGFDLVRIASAAVANVRHGRAAQGGSTITQQLARQSFLTPDKTYRRKLQELILAARIERMYTKDQILELYLNKVYFGDGLYGVEAASRGYFGKHASELTVAEAALLAGLVKSPSSYAPTVSLERAIARRNVVLQAMLETGAIDRDRVGGGARRRRRRCATRCAPESRYGQYFKEQVRRELVERFGWQRVYQGGLRVFSTIDMPMQQAAEAVGRRAIAGDRGKHAAWQARRAAAASERREGRRARPSRAAAGGAGRARSARAATCARWSAAANSTRATSTAPCRRERQPGSAFKPFVYAAALEAGFTPASMIERLNEPIDTLQGAWTPEDEHSTAESMSLRAALRTSSNRAAVRLLQEVGIGRTVQYAKTMGVGDVPSVPSLALGSGEVTLQSMTAAYAAFANRGRVPQPMLIRRVEDSDGRVLYAASESATRAISETTAFLMSNMMADVINAGTGAGRARSASRCRPPARPARPTTSTTPGSSASRRSS